MNSSNMSVADVFLKHHVVCLERVTVQICGHTTSGFYLTDPKKGPTLNVPQDFRNRRVSSQLDSS